MNQLQKPPVFHVRGLWCALTHPSGCWLYYYSNIDIGGSRLLLCMRFPHLKHWCSINRPVGSPVFLHRKCAQVIRRMVNFSRSAMITNISLNMLRCWLRFDLGNQFVFLLEGLFDIHVFCFVGAKVRQIYSECKFFCLFRFNPWFSEDIHI